MQTESSKQTDGLAGTALEKYRKDLHRFLVRRLQHAEDAADLAQEVYLRLLRVENSEWVRKPQAYLYGVAAHVVFEYRMRTEKEPVTFDSEVMEQLAENPAGVQPDELGDRLGLERQLERLLGTLPPTHLAVLLLHKRDGLSYEEVARKLQLSVHTVQKYIFQAKARIRMEWQRQEAQ